MKQQGQQQNNFTFNSHETKENAITSIYRGELTEDEELHLQKAFDICKSQKNTVNLKDLLSEFQYYNYDKKHPFIYNFIFSIYQDGLAGGIDYEQFHDSFLSFIADQDDEEFLDFFFESFFDIEQKNELSQDNFKRIWKLKKCDHLFGKATRRKIIKVLFAGKSIITSQEFSGFFSNKS